MHTKRGVPGLALRHADLGLPGDEALAGNAQEGVAGALDLGVQQGAYRCPICEACTMISTPNTHYPAS